MALTVLIFPTVLGRELGSGPFGTESRPVLLHDGEMSSLVMFRRQTPNYLYLLQDRELRCPFVASTCLLTGKERKSFNKNIKNTTYQSYVLRAEGNLKQELMQSLKMLTMIQTYNIILHIDYIIYI